MSVGEVVDNTNTLLDDHIKMIKNGITTTGTEKKSLLAWRGFPDLNGTFVDDNVRPPTSELTKATSVLRLFCCLAHTAQRRARVLSGSTLDSVCGVV